MKGEVHYSRKARVILSALILGSVFSYGMAEAAIIDISSVTFPYIDSSSLNSNNIVYGSTLGTGYGPNAIKLTYDTPGNNSTVTINSGSSISGNPGYSGTVYVGTNSGYYDYGDSNRVTVNIGSGSNAMYNNGSLPVGGHINAGPNGKNVDLWAVGKQTLVNNQGTLEIAGGSANTGSFNLLLDAGAEGINTGLITTGAHQMDDQYHTFNAKGFSYDYFTPTLFEEQPYADSLGLISAGVVTGFAYSDRTPSYIGDRLRDNLISYKNLTQNATSYYREMLNNEANYFQNIPTPTVQFINSRDLYDENKYGYIFAKDSIGVLNLKQYSSTTVNEGFIYAKHGMSSGYIYYRPTNVLPDTTQVTLFSNRSPLYNVNGSMGVLINNGSIYAYGNGMEVGPDSYAYNLNTIVLSNTLTGGSTENSSATGMVTSFNANWFSMGSGIYNCGTITNDNTLSNNYRSLIGMAGVFGSEVINSGIITLDNGSKSATGIYANDSHVVLLDSPHNSPWMKINGSNGAGIFTSGSRVDIYSPSLIGTSGAIMPGMYLANSNLVDLAGRNYISTDGWESPGVELNSSRGILSAEIWTLQDNSEGILAKYSTGNFNNCKIFTLGQYSMGVAALSGSQLKFDSGSIKTMELFSKGVLLDDFSQGEISGSSIETNMDYSQGIYATNNSVLQLSASNIITTLANDSSGIEIDNSATGRSNNGYLDITVNGDNSHGIYLHDNGQFNLYNTNTTITGNNNNTTAGILVDSTNGINTLVDNTTGTTKINMTNGGNGIESLKQNSMVTINATNYDVNLQMPSTVTSTPLPWALTVSDGGVINLNGQQGTITADNQATSLNYDTVGFGFSDTSGNHSTINVTTDNLLVDIQGGDGARITYGSLNILGGTTTIKEHTDATHTGTTWRSAVEINANGILNVASGATLNLSHDRTIGVVGAREAALTNSGNAKTNLDGTLSLKVGNGSGSVDSSALRALNTSEVTLGPTSVVIIEGLAGGFNGIDTANNAKVNGTSANPISINTTGIDSNAIIAADDSRVNLTNTPVTVTMSGANNRGIQSGTTSQVNLTNASAAMTLSGADSMGVEATDNSRVNISGNGGLQLELTGTNPVGISATDTAEVKVDAPTIIKVPANETALKIADSGKIFINASEANDVVIEGDLVGDGATSGGNMNVNLTTTNSKFTGSSTKGTETINLKLDNNAVWNVTGTSTLSNLNINNGGLVNLTYTGPGNYNTITTEKLSGNNGKIMFTTDMQASRDSFNVQNNSAKLIITGDSSGEHKISIKDASLISLQKADGYLLLIEDQTSGGATFKGEALETGGIFRYNPEIVDNNPPDNIGKVDDADKYTGYNLANAKNWYLTGFKIDPEDPFQPGMKPNLGSGAERYMNYWRELDSLLLRLGELRDNPNASGIWARIKHGEESINNIGLDSGKYTMFQLGYDHKYAENAKGKRYWGIAFDHITSNQNYTVTAKGESSINSLSLYDTWLGNKGHYLDIVAKAGRMGRDFNYFGNFPDNGESKNWYYSLSGEYGRKIQNKDGLYIEPQAQLTLGRINSASYTTGQQNIQVVNDAVNSAVLRIGTTVGKHYDTDGNGSNGYAKIFWNKEFGGVLGLHLNDGVDTYDSSENYGSGWWTAGIGANAQIDRATNVYLDLEKSFGGSVKTKWQINAGVRWEF